MMSSMLVKTHSFELPPQKEGLDYQMLLFRGPMALRYKILNLTIDRILSGFADNYGEISRHRLIVSTREYGPAVNEGKFLAVRVPFIYESAEVEMPRVLLSAGDPADSDALQWAIWQGLHVGSSSGHEVFDVSHLKLEGFDDERPHAE